MKIQDAWIDDPAERGVAEHSRLCVEVDEWPDVTIEPAPFSGGWMVGKYGPFIKYSCSEGKVSAGDFNIRFRGRFQSVVDISLFLTGRELYRDDYALNLSRARQLVRKWDKDWRLLLADKDAQNGKIVWRPVESHPKCKYFIEDKQAPCGDTVAGTVSIKGVEIPFCKNHLRAYNTTHAALRATSK